MTSQDWGLLPVIRSSVPKPVHGGPESRHGDGDGDIAVAPPDALCTAAAPGPHDVRPPRVDGCTTRRPGLKRARRRTKQAPSVTTEEFA